MPQPTRQRRVLPALMVPVVLAALLGPASPPARGQTQKITPPELEGATGYLNSAGPVRLQDLRGKIVVLDFWTLC